jgi:hypothetical protein
MVPISLASLLPSPDEITNEKVLKNGIGGVNL